MRHSELASKRVVAYVRISNDGQEKGSDNQEGRIARYTKTNSITIQEWYKDNEGKNPRTLVAHDASNCPQVSTCSDNDVKENKIDIILCAYQERLGLIGHTFGYWITEFAKYGVSFWDTTGHNLSSVDPASIERLQLHDRKYGMARQARRKDTRRKRVCRKGG